jgi:RNA polymerase sigma factor (sigma-70 family)
VEASALTTRESMSALRGPSPLLRLQSDERLIAMTRRGQHAAFEVLFSRYQSRLLAFCRHMLSSREDAEDVLQEVFTAAFNAVLADDRPINVRPWLYRIARNRSLNHLRRASAIGVDSMDVHFADHGLSTGERVLRRESFRQLLGDVKELPETQRTALLLREIDALSYEQIADAMETTVPSVKSLLVRARISLAEAAEARQMSCEEVRLQLGEAAEGLGKLEAPARRHVRGCERCRSFKQQLKANNHALAAIFPVGPLLLAKKLLLTKLGSTASAGHVGAGAGATAGVSAGAAASGGASVSGGLLTAGAGAVATKAAAGLAAAAIVTAGAVAAEHSSPPAHPHHAAVTSAYVPSVAHVSEPVVVHTVVQPVSLAPRHALPAYAAKAHLASAHRPPAPKPPKSALAVTSGTQQSGAATNASSQAAGTAVKPPSTTPAKPGAPSQVTEVTTGTTSLPSSATAPTTSTPTVTATPSATPAEDPTGGTPSPAAEPAPQPTTSTAPTETTTTTAPTTGASETSQTTPPPAAGSTGGEQTGSSESTSASAGPSAP